MASVVELRTGLFPDRRYRRVRFRQHQQLIHANRVPDAMFLLRCGWAVRYRLMTDGRRQISAFYLTGDLCDPAWLNGEAVCQPVQAVTDVDAVELSCTDLLGPARSQPYLSGRLAHEFALRSAIDAEHQVSLGRRTAAERLAQLFCEIHWRMDAVGEVRGGECAMPLTQVDLADICGLTAIHVNRVLQELRGAGMIELKSRRLKVIDHDRLARLAMFDPRYLSGVAKPRLRDSVVA